MQLQLHSNMKKNSNIFVILSLANLWQIFHHGLVQNTAHKQAFCKGHVTYYLLQALFKAEISEGLEPATSF